MILLQNGPRIDRTDLALSGAAAEAAAAPAAGDGVLAIDLSKGIVLEDLERTIIERVLVRTGWNRTRAAQFLGLSRETLRYRIEKHNLKAPSADDDA